MKSRYAKSGHTNKEKLTSARVAARPGSTQGPFPKTPAGGPQDQSHSSDPMSTYDAGYKGIPVRQKQTTMDTFSTNSVSTDAHGGDAGKCDYPRDVDQIENDEFSAHSNQTTADEQGDTLPQENVPCPFAQDKFGEYTNQSNYDKHGDPAY